MQSPGANVGRLLQLASGARRRRHADHVVARATVDLGEAPQHRRLTGAGKRLDRVDAVPAQRERAHRRRLVGIQDRL